MVGSVAQGCWVDEYEYENDDRFPIARHELLPAYSSADGQIASGAPSGEALDQPIPFSHNIHAGTLELQCEFCHSEARDSIHSGVPPLQTCMNCHKMVKTDNPDVLKIHAYYCEEPPCQVMNGPFGPVAPDEAKPIPWNKVHDLPDFVHFSHKRHIRGGLECAECHGDITQQGKKVGDTVPSVMQRSPSMTMQMGWCLDCHASHPSIDKNYGDKADLRRAELKDCWTCHK
jgi:hypothetical protein